MKEEYIKRVNEWWENFDIREALESNDMTQKELAEKSGATTSCISNLAGKYARGSRPAFHNKAKLYEFFVNNPEYTVMKYSRLEREKDYDKINKWFDNWFSNIGLNRISLVTKYAIRGKKRLVVLEKIGRPNKAIAYFYVDELLRLIKEQEKGE